MQARLRHALQPSSWLRPVRGAASVSREAAAVSAAEMAATAEAWIAMPWFQSAASSGAIRMAPSTTAFC